MLKEWIYLIYLVRALRKRNIYIVLFTVSVLGLAVVQYRYLQIGLILAKVQFNKKIENSVAVIKKDLSQPNQLTFLIGKVLEKDSTYFRLGLDSIQDASSHFLNDFITERLVSSGVETDFSYDLFTKDSIHYLNSPTGFKKQENVVAYPIEIIGYLPEIIDKRLILELQFKNLNTYFLSQLNGLTVPSLLFILGIILAIIWALRTYYWQRNLITTTNEFINNLTHELKTPVFSISLATKLLERESQPKQQKVISMIRQQTERLSKHIDKVLELGNLEHKKNVVSTEKLDFYPSLSKLCQEFETLSEVEQMDFTYVLDEGPYWINVEQFHLENAVNNLLDNAKKYSENPRIELRASKNGQELIITIKDNGKGIHPKKKDLIFKKYYRVSHGNLHDVKGFGLGLYYVKTIIEELGGTIAVRSSLGKGSEFTVGFPIQTEDV